MIAMLIMRCYIHLQLRDWQYNQKYSCAASAGHNNGCQPPVNKKEEYATSLLNSLDTLSKLITVSQASHTRPTGPQRCGIKEPAPCWQKETMTLRRSAIALLLVFVIAGCSNAARVGILGTLDLEQHATYSRSLLQRQKTAAGRVAQHQASVAASANVKPRGSQQGSIPARNKRVADSGPSAKTDARTDATRVHRSVGSIAPSRAGSGNAAVTQSTLAKQTVSSSSSRKGPNALDFGDIPTLDLSSGLDNMQAGLSDLVNEFKQQGGFWREGSLQDNISNMVQLGVKGTLGLVSPIVNGLTGGIPITVPSINGKCLQGKAIRTTSTGLFGSKKRVTKCLIGTGSQVADYLSKAAGSLAGMAGEVLDGSAAPGAVQSSVAPLGDAAAAEQVAAVPAAGLTTDPVPVAAPATVPGP